MAQAVRYLTWRAAALILVYPAGALLVLLGVSSDPVAPGQMGVAVLLALMLGLSLERMHMGDGAALPAMGRHVARAMHGLWQGLGFGVFMAILTPNAPAGVIALSAGAGAAVFGALSAAFWRDRGGAGDLAGWAGARVLIRPWLVPGAALVGAAAGGVWMTLAAILALALVFGPGPGERDAPGARARRRLFALCGCAVAVLAAADWGNMIP